MRPERTRNREARLLWKWAKRVRRRAAARAFSPREAYLSRSGAAYSERRVEMGGSGSNFLGENRILRGSSKSIYMTLWYWCNH